MAALRWCGANAVRTIQPGDVSLPAAGSGGTSLPFLPGVHVAASRRGRNSTATGWDPGEGATVVLPRFAVNESSFCDADPAVKHAAAGSLTVLRAADDDSG